MNILPAGAVDGLNVDSTELGEIRVKFIDTETIVLQIETLADGAFCTLSPSDTMAEFCQEYLRVYEQKKSINNPG